MAHMPDITTFGAVSILSNAKIAGKEYFHR
jgi:hypothetical protein